MDEVTKGILRMRAEAAVKRNAKRRLVAQAKTAKKSPWGTRAWWYCVEGHETNYTLAGVPPTEIMYQHLYCHGLAVLGGFSPCSRPSGSVRAIKAARRKAAENDEIPF
jgi:hypothetical protein